MVDPSVQAVIDGVTSALSASTAEVTLIAVKIGQLPAPSNPAEVAAALAPVVAAVAGLASGITQVSTALDAYIAPPL